MQEGMQISEDPEERIELAISLLGQTRMEMVPAMRRRGVTVIVDKIGLMDYEGAFSQVKFELDRWASIRAGFVNSDWQELKNCCTVRLTIQGITPVSPYIQWLNRYAQTPGKEQWELPEYKVGVKLQRIHSHHVMFMFHCLASEKWPDEMPLDAEMFHY